MFTLPFLLCCEARISGERCKLPSGSGVQGISPDRNHNLGIFCAGETCLVERFRFFCARQNVIEVNMACTFSRGEQVPSLAHACGRPWAYMVGQIKQCQLTFLLVTSEGIYKMK